MAQAHFRDVYMPSLAPPAVDEKWQVNGTCSVAQVVQLRVTDADCTLRYYDPPSGDGFWFQTGRPEYGGVVSKYKDLTASRLTQLDMRVQQERELRRCLQNAGKASRKRKRNISRAHAGRPMHIPGRRTQKAHDQLDAGRLVDFEPSESSELTPDYELLPSWDQSEESGTVRF